MEQTASLLPSLKTTCASNAQMKPNISALQGCLSRLERGTSLALDMPYHSVLNKQVSNSTKHQRSVFPSDYEVEVALKSFRIYRRAYMQSRSDKVTNGHTSMANSVPKGQINEDHQITSWSSSKSLPGKQSNLVIMDSPTGSEATSDLLQPIPANEHEHVRSSTLNYVSNTTTSLTRPVVDRQGDLEFYVDDSSHQPSRVAGAAADIRVKPDLNPVLSRLLSEAENNHPVKYTNPGGNLELLPSAENSSQSVTPAFVLEPPPTHSNVNLESEPCTTSVLPQTFKSWLFSIMNSSSRIVQTTDCDPALRELDKKLEKLDFLIPFSNDGQEDFTKRYDFNIPGGNILRNGAIHTKASQDIGIKMPNFLEEDHRAVDGPVKQRKSKNQKTVLSNNFFYRCGQCHDCTFFSQIGLLGHIEQEHKSCKQMKCPYCQEWFERTRLIAHMSATHRETSHVSLSCGGTNAGWQCTFTAETCMDLQRHMTLNHAVERAYVCAICGFSSTVITDHIHHVMSKHHPQTCLTDSVNVTSKMDKNDLQKIEMTRMTKTKNAGKRGSDLNKRKDNKEHVCATQLNTQNKQASKTNNGTHKKRWKISLNGLLGKSLNKTSTKQRKNGKNSVGSPLDSSQNCVKENLCKPKEVTDRWEDNGYESGDEGIISSAPKSCSNLPAVGICGGTDDTLNGTEKSGVRTIGNTSRNNDATGRLQESSPHLDQEDRSEGVVYCCHKCEYRARSLFHFRLHMTQHKEHTDKLIPVQRTCHPLCCGICAYFALDQEDFAQHARYHRQEKPLVCGCCYTDFNTEKEILRHTFQQHPGNPALSFSRKLLYDRMRLEKQRMIRMDPKVSLGRSEIHKHLKSLKWSRQNKSFIKVQHRFPCFV